MRRAPLTVVLGVALVLALFGAVAVATQPSEAGQAQRSRVIDKTIRCPIAPQAGIRQLHINAQAGVRDQDDASKWFALPHVSLYSGPSPGVSIGMQAGGPRIRSGAPQQASTFWIDNDLCRPSSARVALSPGTLGGGAASPLLERFECVMPRRILVHIRAEFRTPASLRRGEFTEVPVKAAKLAVRSESGKRLVYAEVFESGKARLFMAANCARD